MIKQKVGIDYKKLTEFEELMPFTKEKEKIHKAFNKLKRGKHDKLIYR